jgi:hypothetical protein
VLKTKNGFGAPILLENGWTATSTSLGTFQPSQDLINGIIYLQGGISGGTSDVVGTVAFHPSSTVFIPVDECNTTNGRIEIDTSGTVTVEGSLTDAQCFTSFEGDSWGTADTATPLTLENGWTGGPFGTGAPAVGNLNGIVRFLGAMATGAPTPSPSSFRPASPPPRRCASRSTSATPTTGNSSSPPTARRPSTPRTGSSRTRRASRPWMESLSPDR